MCLREHRGARPPAAWVGGAPSLQGRALLPGACPLPGSPPGEGLCPLPGAGLGDLLCRQRSRGGPRWAGSGPGSAAADGEENENAWENCGNLTCTSDAVPAQPFLERFVSSYGFYT